MLCIRSWCKVLWKVPPPELNEIEENEWLEIRWHFQWHFVVVKSDLLIHILVLKFWNQWNDEIHPSWKLEELTWSTYVLSASMWSVFQYLQRIHWIQIHKRGFFWQQEYYFEKIESDFHWFIEGLIDFFWIAFYSRSKSANLNACK